MRAGAALPTPSILNQKGGDRLGGRNPERKTQKNKIEAQRSGFDFERRSDGENELCPQGEASDTQSATTLSRCGTLAAGSLSLRLGLVSGPPCGPVRLPSALLVVTLRRLRDARLPYDSEHKHSGFQPSLVCVPRSGPSALLRSPPRFFLSRCGLGAQPGRLVGTSFTSFPLPLGRGQSLRCASSSIKSRFAGLFMET